MSISIDTYCLQCLLRRNIALAQTLGTEEQAMAFAKEIMKLCINAPEGVSSPWFGPQIADLLHEMYGLDYDRFRQEKLDSNRFVLERLPAIREKVTAAKDPVLAIAQNDATREDAAAVGIPFPVIDNGNRVAGTQLDMLSEEAAAALSGADVILAKGMANAETMLGCGYNVYYAFLVKCKRFVTRFGKPMFTPMLVKERE